MRLVISVQTVATGITACPECKKQPPQGSAFCDFCGEKLSLSRSQCGEVIPPGGRF